ncbi:P-loop containing nucleoside triphosphate hydrolase protein [Hypoxylon trugodes]|uniref:P-loop containing nucleoside triphosphate hydrolase protein n=1 Tax=Hypoxylon trugodes TaxID=326681 RepID=UPI00218FBAE1|nr:P-loop containing nucleoside triphosphate hydrolase protein [Hypoxylon trugodes]KAI1390720.1 P-loop containing nucleoside triphosphate hydrolase protein [Hypoxylon trugodes]
MTTGSGLPSREAGKSREFRIPIAKSFSFTIPEIFRPSNPFLVRWIDNLPASVEREKPLEPAHIQAPKRALDSVYSEHNNEEVCSHRTKRAKITTPSADHGLSVEKRRSSVAESSRSLLRRVSTACHRAVSFHSHHTRNETPSGSPVRASLSPLGTPLLVTDRPRMRFVLVGDSGCGKSSLLLRYYRDTFTETYTKTQYELFTKIETVDEKEVDLELWDTSGDLGLHQLQLLSYLAWDAVFLCFSVDSTVRFANAQTQWVDEIRKYCGDIPIILLGLKKDTRMGTGIWAPLYPHIQARITATEGSTAATIMRAVKYIECSAKTGENVERVFQEGIRTVLCGRDEEKDLARVRKAYEDEEDAPPAKSFAKFMCFA